LFLVNLKHHKIAGISSFGMASVLAIAMQCCGSHPGGSNVFLKLFF